MTQAARQSDADPLVEGRWSTIWQRSLQRPDGRAALAEVRSKIVKRRGDRILMRESDWQALAAKYRPHSRCEPKRVETQRRSVTSQHLIYHRPDGRTTTAPDTRRNRWRLRLMQLRDRLRPGEVTAAVSKLMGIEESEGCGCRSLRKRMNKMGWRGTLRWLFTDEGRRWLACVPKRIDGINCTWQVKVE